MSKYHCRWHLTSWLVQLLQLVRLIKRRCQQMEDPVLYDLVTRPTGLRGISVQTAEKCHFVAFYAIVTHTLDSSILRSMSGEYTSTHAVKEKRKRQTGKGKFHCVQLQSSRVDG